MASEQRYRSVIETIRDLLYIIDPNGKFNYLNPEFEKLTVFSADEFIGRPFTDILETEYVESTLERFRRGLSGETIPIYEVGLRHKDGGKVPVELKVTSLLDAEGTTLGRIGVARDIHERKVAEEERKRLEKQLLQVQKMEAVGTLAGGIAHDFNNVLGIIVGNIELAMMDVPDWNPAHQNLREIRKASLRARDLVKQILTFSRQTDQKATPIKISPVIKESLKMLRSSISSPLISNRISPPRWIPFFRTPPRSTRFSSTFARMRPMPWAKREAFWKYAWTIGGLTLLRCRNTYLSMRKSISG